MVSHGVFRPLKVYLVTIDVDGGGQFHLGAPESLPATAYNPQVGDWVMVAFCRSEGQ